MAVLQFVVYEILGEASLLIGLLALIGLLIQKKPAEKVVAGTVKTIVGFLIFGIGSSAAQGALNGFQTLFVTAFGLEGVTPISEAITAQAQTLFPMVIALIMVGGFLCNLVIAKLTKFKFIFLTGGHSLFLSALLAVMLKALGLSDAAAIIIGSVIHGFAAALYPAIAQKSMQAVTGSDEIAIGHYCTLAYAFSGWLGSKVGDPKDSTENINLPGWLSMFKDYIVSVSLSIGVIYYIAAIGRAPGRRNPLAGMAADADINFYGRFICYYHGCPPVPGRDCSGICRHYGEVYSWRKAGSGLSGCVPLCADGNGTWIYFRLCGRLDLYVYYGGYEDNRYDSGSNSLLLHRSYCRRIRKRKRRLERLCAWGLCDRRSDFRRPGGYLWHFDKRWAVRKQLPGDRFQFDWNYI